MLLSFSFSGFRSFGDEAILDLTSHSLRTNVPRKDQTWTECTERVAAIYGPNASGKTTLLNAIWALASAIRRPETTTIFQPCSGRQCADPVSEYRVDFVAHGIRYHYEVEAHSWGIGKEALYSFPHGAKRLLFTRTQAGKGEKLQFSKGSSLSGPTAEVLKITQPRALYLATANRYGHKTLAPIAQGICASVGIEKISFRDAQDVDVIKRVIMEMLATPDEQADLVRALIQAGDLGIEQIDIRYEEIPDEIRQRVIQFVEALREGDENLSTDDVPRLQDKIVFVHHGENGSTFELPLGSQSSGTLTWLTIAWHALNAIRGGSVLLVDELDASLHPELVRYVVNLFASSELNTTGAQLIFTTHDVSLLGNSPTRLLQPRNVWFVEKDNTGNSELFSLDDFDNRPGNNSERRYMAGQFGAVPDIDDGLLYDFVTTPSSDPEQDHE